MDGRDCHSPGRYSFLVQDFKEHSLIFTLGTMGKK